MLLRISLILAILVGAGTIFLTQKMAREHFTAIRDSRDENIKGRAQEKARAEKSEREHTATKGVLTQTKDTLAKTEEELNGTKQQLQTAQDGLAKTRADLAKAIEDRKAKEAELAKWESLNLKPEQIAKIVSDLKTSQDDIAALEDEKKILGRNVAELKNKIELILGREDYVVPLPEGTKGNVVAVDPKWNFVILDLGADKGMLEGGVLMVHRNSKLVGKVRIREVMPNRSVAHLMSGWTLGDVEEGDQVIY
jgi:predicted RNase H-like nuclease (RuvC/YqgF family)